MLSSAVRTFEDLSRYVQNNELTERRNLDESERPMQFLKLKFQKLKKADPQIGSSVITCDKWNNEKFSRKTLEFEQEILTFDNLDIWI